MNDDKEQSDAGIWHAVAEQGTTSLSYLCCVIAGDPPEARTRDNIIKSDVLYQLS